MKVKEEVLYKQQYNGLLIEIKRYSGKVFLYVNGKERDYLVDSPKLECTLEDGTNVEVVLKSERFFRTAATIYVNKTQIDYVKKING